MECLNAHSGGLGEGCVNCQHLGYQSIQNIVLLPFASRHRGMQVDEGVHAVAPVAAAGMNETEMDVNVGDVIHPVVLDDPHELVASFSHHHQNDGFEEDNVCTLHVSDYGGVAEFPPDGGFMYPLIQQLDGALGDDGALSELDDDGFGSPLAADIDDVTD